MLPSLTRFDVPGRAVAGASLVPPPHFKPLGKSLSQVRFGNSDYQTATGLSDAQRAGLRYERDFNIYMSKEFPDYVPGPHIHFYSDEAARTVQPDGVLAFSEVVYVFEIKYQHVPEAWWQLVKLYRPLVERIFVGKPVRCVEVCRSYDPATGFPCDVELIDDLSKWLYRSEPSDVFGIYKWRT
jgi:hypothetical protein